jgi:hypothetical protein
MRGLSAAAVVVWGMLGHVDLCQAQLFPNLPIRREKVPCEQEAPFYKFVRHQYYGYFPTCWRRFPPGWTCPCPNPELPNWEASKAELPLQTDLEYFQGLPGLEEEGMGLEGELGPGLEGPPGREPALPRERSPFELDTPPAGAPPTSPFEMDVRPPAVPPPGDAASRRHPVAPGSVAAAIEVPSIGLSRTEDVTVAPASNRTNVGSEPPPAFVETTRRAPAGTHVFQPSHSHRSGWMRILWPWKRSQP